jgi:hypothetical protein
MTRLMASESETILERATGDIVVIEILKSGKKDKGKIRGASKSIFKCQPRRQSA